jgi:hypothetical protein
MKKLFILLMLVSLFCVPDAYASDDSDTDEKHNTSIGVWTAYSPFSSSFFAKMENTNFALLGLSYTHSTFDIGNKEFYLTSELTLFGRTHFPVNGVSGHKDQRIGLGMVPARLTIPFGNLFTGIGVGIFLFDDRFPNDEGTLLNVTIDASIGYKFRITESNYFSISYRFHHLSNAGRGNANPGIDSNMFVFRYSTSL